MDTRIAADSLASRTSPRYKPSMLSVVIPTLDAEEGLARTLASLVPAAAEGVVREVVVADGGSRDGSGTVADAAGCQFLVAANDWAAQVAAGTARARRAQWLLVLPPYVILEGNWFREVSIFIERAERNGRAHEEAGVFRLDHDAFGWRARIAERMVALRGAIFGRPAPEQGLLVSRLMWERLMAGGMPRSHAALVGRIGRRRIRRLKVRAVMLAATDWTG